MAQEDAWYLVCERRERREPVMMGKTQFMGLAYSIFPTRKEAEDWIATQERQDLVVEEI